MATLRKDQIPAYTEISPEFQNMLARNGMYAQVGVDDKGFYLYCKNHEGVEHTYDISETQYKNLVDWGMGSVNKKAYNTFANIVKKDYDVPRSYIYAQSAGGRVNMGQNGFRVDGNVPFARRADQYGRNVHPGYGHPHHGGFHPHGGPGRFEHPERGMHNHPYGGYDLRRCESGMVYYAASRPGGMRKPGELQTGYSGFYAKTPQQGTDVLQDVNLRVSTIPATPYKDLISSNVYFTNEKWQECLSSHGIVIDANAKTMTIQSTGASQDVTYNLTDEQLKKLTANSVKECSVTNRIGIINGIIGNDFSQGITFDMLNSTSRLSIAGKDGLQISAGRSTVDSGMINATHDHEMLTYEQLKQKGSVSLEQLVAYDKAKQAQGVVDNQNHGRQQPSYQFVMDGQQPPADLRIGATVDGNTLANFRETKAWYREGANGRELSVGGICVASANGKYYMSGIVDGQEMSKEIDKKAYDKFISVDDYHRMKMFAKEMDDVAIKTRPELRMNPLEAVVNGLTAAHVILHEGAEIAADIDRMGHHPHHPDHHDHGNGMPSVYFKPGVDTPEEVMSRQYDVAIANHEGGLVHGRGV